MPSRDVLASGIFWLPRRPTSGTITKMKMAFALGGREIGGGDKALTSPHQLPSRRRERFGLRAHL